MIPIFFSRGAGFESWLGYQPSGLRLFIVFFSPYKQIRDAGMRTRNKSLAKSEIKFDIFSSEKSHYFVELYL